MSWNWQIQIDESILTNWYQQIYSYVIKSVNLHWWIYTDVLMRWIYPSWVISMNFQWCHKTDESTQFEIPETTLGQYQQIFPVYSNLMYLQWWVKTDNLHWSIYTNSQYPKKCTPMNQFNKSTSSRWYQWYYPDESILTNLL